MTRPSVRKVTVGESPLTSDATSRSNMTVVQATSVHVPTDTRILHRECRSLVEAGYRVVLVAPGISASDKAVDLLFVPPPSNRLLRATQTAIRVIWTSIQERPTVLHVHDPELLPWAQLARLTGTKVIYDMHENLPAAILRKPWIPQRLRPAVAWTAKHMERVLIRGLPVVFAEESYPYLFSSSRQCVTVLNLPRVDMLPTSASERKFEHFSVGYVGGVSPDRGSKETLQALRKVRHNGQRVDFHCVGPCTAAHRQELLALWREGDSGCLTLYGRVDPLLAWRTMAQCHVGMAVLHPSPNYLASYPTKMFEYMGIGIPVIVSDFPLYREIIDRYRCGLCVDPTDALAIADAVEYLATHPEEAEGMGRRGAEAVREKLNWRAEERKLLRFYEILTEESARTGRRRR